MGICLWGMLKRGARVEIHYFDQVIGATVVDDPMFDAGMERLRS